MKPDPEPRTLSRPWLGPLKWAVAALAAYLVFRKIDLGEIWPVLARADWRFLGLCLALLFLTSLLNALRWKILLRAPDLGLGKYLYFVFVGHFFNLFLPSSMAAEAVKVVAFGRKYGNLQVNIGIALFARGLGALTQLAIGALALTRFHRELSERGVYARLDPGTGWYLGLGAAALLGAAAAWRFRRALMRQKWVSAMVEIGREPGLLARTAALTVLIQALSVVSGYVLFLCVFPQAEFWKIVLFLLVIQMILMLPFSMGGIGVREYLVLLFFSDLGGMPAEASIAANLLGYIPLVLFAAAGGAWMLFRKHAARGATAAVKESAGA